MWLKRNEAYALLTVLNVIAKIDPGGLLPYVSPLRGVLKEILCEHDFSMKGFHKKIGVELPNLGRGDSETVAKMMRALVDELEVLLVWRGDDEVRKSASCSLQCFVLTSNGWQVEFVVAEDVARERVPLMRFSECTLTDRPARLLPEFSSDSRNDFEALSKIYRRL